MRYSNRTFIRWHQNRLRVEQSRIAGGRITRVTDGQSAPDFRENILSENVGDQAHCFVNARGETVGGDNPRGLLPAMLESMQSQVSEFLRFRMSEDRHHPALVVECLEQHSPPSAPGSQLSDFTS